MDHTVDEPVVIIGAGVAGLTAADELAHLGIPAVLVERQDDIGGLARTVQRNGYRFDLGGHRFFTRIPQIKRLWDELLGDEFLLRPRLSRIYYRQRFFSYPLKPLQAMHQLGALHSLRIVGSYLRARLLPCRRIDSFENWVSNRFGRALYETFFKAYTEKVWGRPCSQLSADWAAQRIKDLSLTKALFSSLRLCGRTPVSLIEQFDYPRLGPGQMWQALLDRACQRGQQIHLNTSVTGLVVGGQRVRGVRVRGPKGEEEWPCSGVISSMPLPDLVRALDGVTSAALDAAGSLKHREMLTVALVLKGRDHFPDNWIYVHDPAVRVGRIQNFGNWSPNLVPTGDETVLGMEYFCNAGDELWETEDKDLIAMATAEVAALRLIAAPQVTVGFVERVSHAYPVYDPGYHDSLSTIRQVLAPLTNLQTTGRNGLHRYNNMDHSMLSGIYAAQNLAGSNHDLWSINLENRYLEAD